MKALKYFGIGLGLLVALLLIVALFVPKEFKYEKSIIIKSPIDTVWLNVNSLSALDKWSPWNDHDPKMKKEMSGIDGTVGAKQSWSSECFSSPVCLTQSLASFHLGFPHCIPNPSVF